MPVVRCFVRFGQKLCCDDETAVEANSVPITDSSGAPGYKARASSRCHSPIMLPLVQASLSFTVTPTNHLLGHSHTLQRVANVNMAVPDEVAKGLQIHERRIAPPSWDFRHSAYGEGLPLARMAAINGSPAMIQVSDKKPPVLAEASAEAPPAEAPAAEAPAAEASPVPAPVKAQPDELAAPAASVPDEVAKGLQILDRRVAPPSGDFRYSAYGEGQPLARMAAINGSPAMIEVPAKKPPELAEAPAQAPPAEVSPAEVPANAGAAPTAPNVNMENAGSMTIMPDELAAPTRGVVIPSWDFRHGAGGLPMGRRTAINGASAMSYVR